MDRMVLNFGDFINEDLNYTKFDDGVCKLEDRWFYYNPEDDIIYGCDDKPVGDDKLFSFNPVSCIILMNGKEEQYDVNNPVCLIQYDIDDNKVTVYTENAVEYLQSMGFKGTDIQSQQYNGQLNDLFENDEDRKFILLYGDEMIASTFDVIEEN